MCIFIFIMSLPFYFRNVSCNFHHYHFHHPNFHVVEMLITLKNDRNHQRCINIHSGTFFLADKLNKLARLKGVF